MVVLKTTSVGSYMSYAYYILQQAKNPVWWVVYIFNGLWLDDAPQLVHWRLMRSKRSCVTSSCASWWWELRTSSSCGEKLWRWEQRKTLT